jgi:hypothetical protein
LTTGAAEPEVIHGDVPLLPHQLDFLCDTSSYIRVLQGGYRSGKTVAMVAAALDMGLRSGGKPVLAVEPTYRMAMDVFVATAIKMLTAWRVPYVWHKSDKILTVGRGLRFDILCRSADNPRSLEGLTVGGAVIDEWELLDVEALGVAMARVSVGPFQRVCLFGTPEGFGPCYDAVLKKPDPRVKVWTVGTRANITLEADYVERLRDRVGDDVAAEKLDGVRTARGGLVYRRLDHARNFQRRCVDRAEVQVWADFNVGAQCWFIAEVDRATGAAHVAQEVIGYEVDTDQQCGRMISALVRYFAETRGQRLDADDVRHMRIPFVCDSSGRNRAAVGSHTQVVAGHGFRPLYSSKGNPDVEDRILSVNLRLADGKLTIDAERCPFLARAITQQGRMPNGQPAKHADPKQDLSGPVDAIGYGVFWWWPAFRYRANMPASDDDKRQRAWAESYLDRDDSILRC